jgi:hypothetical protein
MSSRLKSRDTAAGENQRQSGFSPETPVISREIEASAAPASRGRSTAFAGTFSVCTRSHELLAMQKVEGSNPFSRFGKGPANWSVFGPLSSSELLTSRGLAEDRPAPCGYARFETRRICRAYSALVEPLSFCGPRIRSPALTALVASQSERDL